MIFVPCQSPPPTLARAGQQSRVCARAGPDDNLIALEVKGQDECSSARDTIPRLGLKVSVKDYAPPLQDHRVGGWSGREVGQSLTEDPQRRFREGAD